MDWLDQMERTIISPAPPWVPAFAGMKESS
jgi:hypothetical protein